MKRGRLVAVRWEDSRLGVGWMHRDKINRGVRCFSVGWVLKDDKRGFVLVASVAPGGHVAGAVVIPRSAIRKVQRLR